MPAGPGWTPTTSPSRLRRRRRRPTRSYHRRTRGRRRCPHSRRSGRNLHDGGDGDASERHPRHRERCRRCRRPPARPVRRSSCSGGHRFGRHRFGRHRFGGHRRWPRPAGRCGVVGGCGPAWGDPSGAARGRRPGPLLPRPRARSVRRRSRRTDPAIAATGAGGRLARRQRHQTPGDRAVDALVVEQVLRGRVRLLRLRERQTEGVVDHLPPGHVGPVDEGDRHAGGAGPAGAADPVHVGLVVVGALVVDHVRDPVDVDAAGGDVGGDQDVDTAGAEPLQRLLPERPG